MMIHGSERIIVVSESDKFSRKSLACYARPEEIETWSRTAISPRWIGKIWKTAACVCSSRMCNIRINCGLDNRGGTIYYLRCYYY